MRWAIPWWWNLSSNASKKIPGFPIWKTWLLKSQPCLRSVGFRLGRRLHTRLQWKWRGCVASWNGEPPERKLQRKMVRVLCFYDFLWIKRENKGPVWYFSYLVTQPTLWKVIPRFKGKRAIDFPAPVRTRLFMSSFWNLTPTWRTGLFRGDGWCMLVPSKTVQISLVGFHGAACTPSDCNSAWLYNCMITVEKSHDQQKITPYLLASAIPFRRPLMPTWLHAVVASRSLPQWVKMMQMTMRMKRMRKPFMSSASSRNGLMSQLPLLVKTSPLKPLWRRTHARFVDWSHVTES